MALPIYVLWVLEAWLGALFGSLIANPEIYGLDFLLSIYFLGLVLGFRKRWRRASVPWRPRAHPVHVGSYPHAAK
jgi:predicted branched-subunit amino acid permease